MRGKGREERLRFCTQEREQGKRNSEGGGRRRKVAFGTMYEGRRKGRGEERDWERSKRD